MLSLVVDQDTVRNTLLSGKSLVYRLRVYPVTVRSNLFTDTPYGVLRSLTLLFSIIVTWSNQLMVALSTLLPSDYSIYRHTRVSTSDSVVVTLFGITVSSSLFSLLFIAPMQDHLRDCTRRSIALGCIGIFGLVSSASTGLASIQIYIHTYIHIGASYRRLIPSHSFFTMYVCVFMYIH